MSQVAADHLKKYICNGTWCGHIQVIIIAYHYYDTRMDKKNFGGSRITAFVIYFLTQSNYERREWSKFGQKKNFLFYQSAFWLQAGMVL